MWGSIDIEIDQGIGFVWSELGNLLLRNDQVLCDLFFLLSKFQYPKQDHVGCGFHWKVRCDSYFG